jgi:hypothetical protein
MARRFGDLRVQVCIIAAPPFDLDGFAAAILLSAHRMVEIGLKAKQ